MLVCREHVRNQVRWHSGQIVGAQQGALVFAGEELMRASYAITAESAPGARSIHPMSQH